VAAGGEAALDYSTFRFVSAHLFAFCFKTINLFSVVCNKVMESSALDQLVHQLITAPIACC